MLEKIGTSKNREQITNFVTDFMIYLFPILFKYFKLMCGPKLNPRFGPRKTVNSVHSGKMDDPRLKQQPDSQIRCPSVTEKTTNNKRPGKSSGMKPANQLAFLLLVLLPTTCARMCVPNTEKPGT